MIPQSNCSCRNIIFIGSKDHLLRDKHSIDGGPSNRAGNVVRITGQIQYGACAVPGNYRIQNICFRTGQNLYTFRIQSDGAVDNIKFSAVDGNCISAFMVGNRAVEDIQTPGIQIECGAIGSFVSCHAHRFHQNRSAINVNCAAFSCFVVGHRHEIIHGHIDFSIKRTAHTGCNVSTQCGCL